MPYLDILLLVAHEVKGKIPEHFPSWVAQWNRYVPRIFHKAMLDFKASGDVAPVTKQDAGSSILVVSGIN